MSASPFNPSIPQSINREGLVMANSPLRPLTVRGGCLVFNNIMAFVLIFVPIQCHLGGADRSALQVSRLIQSVTPFNPSLLSG